MAEKLGSKMHKQQSKAENLRKSNTCPENLGFPRSKEGQLNGKRWASVFKCSSHPVLCHKQLCMEGQSRSLSSYRGLEERQKQSQAALKALPAGSKGAQTTRTSRREHGPVVKEGPYRFHER